MAPYPSAVLLTSLAFLHAHLSPSEMATEDSSSNSHSSGLGVMPSMSAECTPLKHRYDACFNKWFEDYLGLPAPSPPSSSAGGARDSGVSGFFSQSGSSARRSEPSQSDRRRLRDRLDGECGAMWKEYQSCVLVSQQRAGGLSPSLAHPPHRNCFLYHHHSVQSRQKTSTSSSRKHEGTIPFPFPRIARARHPTTSPFPFQQQARIPGEEVVQCHWMELGACGREGGAQCHMRFPAPHTCVAPFSFHLDVPTGCIFSNAKLHSGVRRQ